jgi:hypothetical protein
MAAANATICNLQPLYNSLQCAAYIARNGPTPPILDPNRLSPNELLTGRRPTTNYLTNAEGGSGLTLPSVAITGSITNLGTIVSITGRDPTPFVKPNDMIYFGYMIDVQGPYVVASVTSNAITLSKKYVGPNLTNTILSVIPTAMSGSAGQTTPVLEDVSDLSGSVPYITGSILPGTSYINTKNTNLPYALGIGDLVYINGSCNQYDTDNGDGTCTGYDCRLGEVDLLDGSCQTYACKDPAAETNNGDGSCTTAVVYQPAIRIPSYNLFSLSWGPQVGLATDSSTNYSYSMPTYDNVVYARPAEERYSGYSYQYENIYNLNDKIPTLGRANFSYPKGVLQAPYSYNIITNGTKASTYRKTSSNPSYKYPKSLGPYYVAENPAIGKIMIRSKTTGDLDANGKIMGITFSTWKLIMGGVKEISHGKNTLYVIQKTNKIICIPDCNALPTPTDVTPASLPAQNSCGPGGCVATQIAIAPISISYDAYATTPSVSFVNGTRRDVYYATSGLQLTPTWLTNNVNYRCEQQANTLSVSNGQAYTSYMRVLRYSPNLQTCFNNTQPVVSTVLTFPPFPQGLTASQVLDAETQVSLDANTSSIMILRKSDNSVWYANTNVTSATVPPNWTQLAGVNAVSVSHSNGKCVLISTHNTLVYLSNYMDFYGTRIIIPYDMIWLGNAKPIQVSFDGYAMTLAVLNSVGNVHFMNLQINYSITNKVPPIGLQNVSISKVAYSTGGSGSRISLNKSVVGCAAGTYGPTCTPCDPGYYSPVGAPNQIPCTGGNLCIQTGQVPCPAGTYCPAGATSVLTCTAGSYCPLGTGAPVPCTAGNYCPAGATAQTPCTAGNYCPAGTTAQIPCITGYYCPAGTQGPIPCTPGNYCPAGTGAPLPCAANTFSGASASTCTTCANNYQSSGGSSACTACPANYQSTGGSSCTACPNNFTSTSGQSCTACPTGQISGGGTPCTLKAPNINTIIQLPANISREQYPITTDSSRSVYFNAPGYLSSRGGPSWGAPSIYSLLTTNYGLSNSITYYTKFYNQACMSPARSETYQTFTTDAAGLVISASLQQCCVEPGCPVASSSCPAGNYCPAGTTAQIPCITGYYCPAGTQGPIPCTPGNYCPAGAASQTPYPT